MDISIYVLIDPRDSAPKYVGQSRDPKRRLNQHMGDATRCDSVMLDWLRDLKYIGMRPEIKILEVVSTDLADKAERKWIKKHWAAGAALFNLTSGGAQGSKKAPKKRRQAKKEYVSKFAGVQWSDAKSGWVVKAPKDGKMQVVGVFQDEVTGARVYDHFAKLAYGAGAILNRNVYPEDLTPKDPALISTLPTQWFSSTYRSRRARIQVFS